MEQKYDLSSNNRENKSCQITRTSEINYDNIRLDIWDKIRGEAQYTDDIEIEDTLFISIVRSTIQRGKIISIQLPHIPRGYFIFNHNHIPGSNIWHYFLDDWKFLADDMVNFIGEPILIIAGPSLPVCHELASKVIVRYEPMQPINNVADSFDENIEAIYSSASSTKTPAFDKSMGKNLFKQLGYLSGDKKALPSKSLNILKYINHFFYENENKLVSKTNNILKSDKFTEFFVTDRQEHAYLEPQGFIAFYEDDVLVLKGSIQCPFYVLKAITELLNLPEDKIRIQQAATGGAFGGKEEFPSIVASFAALVTYLTKKPSKIIFERTEDIEVTTKRHPSYILLRTKMGKNGKIKSIESDIILDSGAYCGISPVVLARSEIAAAGIYKTQAARVRARAMATNNVVSGAFRGFGAPQSFFALEMMINHIADDLFLSPIDIRKLNVLQQGDISATGGKMRQKVLIPQMLDWIEEKTDFTAKYNEYKSKSKEFFNDIYRISTANKDKKLETLINKFEKHPEPLKGIGISTVFHGCGFTGRGEENIKATIRVKFDLAAKQSNKNLEDTPICEIFVSTVEMGQGLLEVFKQIASRVLNIDKKQVKIISGDTHLVPDSGPTVASRSTMIVGGLIYDACQKIISESLPELTLTYKSPPDIVWDEENSQGDAYPAYSWGVCVTELSVDPITFQVSISKITSCFDIGKALNENAAIGQVIGGFAQCIGWSLLEKCEIKDGKILQRTFTDYAIPSSMDIPPIEVKFFDNPYDRGPFGAKCLGELPFVLPPPSIISAIETAVSKKFFQIPLTPEVIQREILS